MKGLIMLFLSIVAVGIGWRYASRDAKRTVGKVVKGNLLIVLIALLAVAIAVTFSSNTTLRLL